MLNLNFILAALNQMLTNVEGNREDIPQSNVQPITLHHIEEPLNYRHISKTVDTHLLVKE